MTRRNAAKATDATALKRHKLKQEFLSDLGAWMLMLPSLLAMVIFSLRPLWMSMIYSTFEMHGFEPVRFIGLANFKSVIGDLLFNTALLNTVKYVFWSLIIGFLPPIILAILLNEVTVFKGGFRFLTYFPTIVPGMVASLLFVFLYYPDSSGLLNMLLGMIGVEPKIWLDNKNLTIMLIIVSASWTGIGGTALYYLAALQGVSRELYEAAMIDGAGIFTRLRKIMLPQLIPIFMLFLVRQMIAVFGIMQEPLVMTGGGPDNASLSIGLLTYQYTFTYGYTDKGLALGVIQFLLGLVMTVFYIFLDRRLNKD